MQKDNEYNELYEKYSEEIIGDGKTLKIGIISDAQIDYEMYPKNIYNYKASLQYLTNQNLDILILAGDMSDNEETKTMELVKQITEENYKKQNTKIIYIMGNHEYAGRLDYYKGNPNPQLNRENFMKIFGQKLYTHKKINGFHFITYSMDSLDVDPYKHYDLTWAKQSLDKAVEDSNNKPIFFISHCGPYNTCIGTYPRWGSTEVRSLLNNYPQVISISGHSHYSLKSDNIIWQGEFTSIGSQCIAQIEVDKTYQNGDVIKDEFNDEDISRSNPMGIILNIDNKQVIIQRVSFLSKLLYNGYYKDPYIIELPLDINKFIYTEKYFIAKAQKPVFNKDTKIYPIVIIKDNKTYFQIKFSQAKHPNYVLNYIVEFIKEKILIGRYKYISDFYIMDEQRKDYITLLCPKEITYGKYIVNIRATDSNGLESESIKEEIEFK